MLFRLGPVEIILILVIIFIIFGAGRLPQLFDMLGKGARSFRRGKKGGQEPATRRTRRKVIKKLD